MAGRVESTRCVWETHPEKGISMTYDRYRDLDANLHAHERKVPQELGGRSHVIPGFPPDNLWPSHTVAIGPPWTGSLHVGNLGIHLVSPNVQIACI